MICMPSTMAAETRDVIEKGSVERLPGWPFLNCSDGGMTALKG